MSSVARTASCGESDIVLTGQRSIAGGRTGAHANASGVLLGVALVLAIGVSVQATDGGTHTVVTSEDGLVSLTITEGAAPPGTAVTITKAPSDEVPEMLLDLGITELANHYVVEPTGVTFDPPARLVRRIPLATQGGYPEEPQVMAMLLLRSGDDDWAWVVDPGFVIDGPAESLLVSGDVPHGGSVLAFGSGLIYSPIAADQLVDIGYDLDATSGFSIPDFLGTSFGDEGHGAAVTGVSSSVGDPAIATLGEVTVSDAGGDYLLDQTLACSSPGETSTALAFTVKGVGDDTYWTDALGLRATAVDVSILGSVECFE